jgi:hypothetical protein
MDVSKFNKYYNEKNTIIFPPDIIVFANKISFFVELVNYWTQILGLVLFKSSFPSNRKNIIKNLIDENLSELTHCETFYNFLLECGLDSNKYKLNELIEIGKNNSIIIKYKKSLYDFVINHTYSDCVEMLGSIEYIYHLISSNINSYFIKSHNKNPSFHFNLHEILDQTHSKELFESSENLEPLESNIKFGSDWIIGVISDLLEN